MFSHVFISSCSKLVFDLICLGTLKFTVQHVLYNLFLELFVSAILKKLIFKVEKFAFQELYIIPNFRFVPRPNKNITWLYTLSAQVAIIKCFLTLSTIYFKHTLTLSLSLIDQAAETNATWKPWPRHIFFLTIIVSFQKLQLILLSYSSRSLTCFIHEYTCQDT